MKSILVIRLTSLGDVILTTPIVRMLANAYPNATIDVAVDPRFSEVWASNPVIKNVRTYTTNEGLSAQAEADERGYDLIVDLQRNRKSRAIVHAVCRSHTTVVRYSKRRLPKIAMVCFKRSVALDHIVERYAEPLGKLGLKLENQDLELWTGGNQPSAQRLADLASPLRIGIAPGAQHATKRYTSEGWAALADHFSSELGASVVALGSRVDVSICDQIQSLAGCVLERADGAMDLATTIRIVDGLDCIVTNDSAMVHIAAARNVPVVVVYGSTIPALGFTPHHVAYEVIEVKELSCRPCSHIGRSCCPKGHFSCMTSIDHTEIYEAVRRLLASVRRLS